jgi:hypothetical protein
MAGKQKAARKQSQKDRDSKKAQDTDETIFSLDPASGLSEDRRRRLLLRRFWQSAAGSRGC